MFRQQTAVADTASIPKITTKMKVKLIPNCFFDSLQSHLKNILRLKPNSDTGILFLLWPSSRWSKYELGLVNDHFLVLNLLTLGMATDSKRFPTLLVFEAVSAIVSTLPVKTFSFPILKSTQLSFLIVLSSFLTGLLEVKRGDSHEG
jgi:hypothetical protein